ncbi:MAG TPA: HDIG domain-containing protein [Gemmatimonadaceae bacterium]|nr:HDIG domain-containing protein [Gemmatimonadaceae bacterium]
MALAIRKQLERLSGPPPAARGAQAAYHGARLALIVALAILTVNLFPASPVVEYPLYEVGSVATENVIAPFAFRVPKESDVLAREREEAARAAEPVFVTRPAALDTARTRLAAFTRAVDAAAATRRPEAAIQAAAQHGVQLRPEEAEYLLNARRREEMSDAVNRVFNRWLQSGVAPAGALDGVRGTVLLREPDSLIPQGTVAERRVPADSLLTFGSMLTRARLVQPAADTPVAEALFTRLVTSFFHPTIVQDQGASARVRDDLRRQVPEFRFEVQAGEKIVGAHEVVTRTEHDKLRALLLQLDQHRGQQGMAQRIAGSVLFNALVLGIFGLALLLFHRAIYESFRSLLLFTVLFAIVIVGAAVVALTTGRPELIPIAFAAIIISVLFDPRLSVIAAMMLAVLIGGQTVFRGTNALFINILGGVAAAYSVRVLRRRNQTYHSTLIIAAAYLLAATAIGMTLGWPLRELALSSGWGTLNALVSVMLAMWLLPLAEEFTGIDTDLRLLEWSDLNRDLMRRLSVEAPGTYAHTMSIANLSEAAANAIGASGLLARVGAYYHDIGKLKKPQYFVENQPKGRNPHDKLKPTTSASIIRNHVSEGLELAAEHRLPKAIRAFITEHHGTGQISYFFEKAKERDGPVGNPAEFRYPGPLPQTAETAVVMLADGVEAATRVLAEPTPKKIRDVVDLIVRQRIEQGQLREAPLTLRQIEQIKEQFARVLIGMHHNRIDYPAASGGVTAEFAGYEPGR